MGWGDATAAGMCRAVVIDGKQALPTPRRRMPPGRPGAAAPPDSVVRRKLVAQQPCPTALGCRQRSLEACDLAHQAIDLMLLPNDHLVEEFDGVLGKAGFDFQVRQALFHVVVLSCHGAYWK